MRSWPTDEWCDACYRDGAAHPLCPLPHNPDDAPIEVGERMPVTRLGLLTDEPPHVCVAAGVAPAADGTLDTVYGTGVAGSADVAAEIAMYEVFERMSLYRLPPGDVVLASAPELPGAADPGRTDPTWWVAAGTESGEPAWLPVDWVQIPRARRRSSAGYRDCDSTGTAVQASEELAVLAGRLEYAERRAVRRLWRTGGKPARTGAMPDGVEPFAAALADRGCQVRLAMAEGDGTVLAIAFIVDSVGERAVGGAAMDLTVEAAGYRAVAEAYGKAIGAGLGVDQPAAQVAVLTGAAVGRARARLGIADSAQVTWLAGVLPAEPSTEYHVGRTTPWLARRGLAAAQVVAQHKLPGWEVAADDAARLFG